MQGIHNVSIQLHTDQCPIQYGLFMGTMSMQLMSEDEDMRRVTLVHLFYALWSANHLDGIYMLTHADMMSKGYVEGVWGSNTFRI